MLLCCGHCEKGGTFATGGVFCKAPPSFHAITKHYMFDRKYIHYCKTIGASFQKMYGDGTKSEEVLTYFKGQCNCGANETIPSPFSKVHRILPLQSKSNNLAGTGDKRECLL